MLWLQDKFKPRLYSVRYKGDLGLLGSYLPPIGGMLRRFEDLTEKYWNTIKVHVVDFGR